MFYLFDIFMFLNETQSITHESSIISNISTIFSVIYNIVEGVSLMRCFRNFLTLLELHLVVIKPFAQFGLLLYL